MKKLEHLSPTSWGSFQAKRVHSNGWFLVYITKKGCGCSQSHTCVSICIKRYQVGVDCGPWKPILHQSQHLFLWLSSEGPQPPGLQAGALTHWTLPHGASVLSAGGHDHR